MYALFSEEVQTKADLTKSDVKATPLNPEESKLQSSSNQSSLGSLHLEGKNDLPWKYSWDWDRGFIGIIVLFFVVFESSVIIAISLSVDNTPANGKYLRKSLIMLWLILYLQLLIHFWYWKYIQFSIYVPKRKLLLLGLTIIDQSSLNAFYIFSNAASCNWSPWSSCEKKWQNQTCGTGQRTKTRSFEYGVCHGNSVDTKECNFSVPLPSCPSGKIHLFHVKNPQGKIQT